MTAAAEEEWRPIPGTAGYEASNLGRIRSVDRTISDGRRYRGRVLKPRATGQKKRYLAVSLPGRKNEKVYRLVLLAFQGPPPAPGLDARHLNDDQSDNSNTNLAWGTRRENLADAKRNGRRFGPPRKTK